MKLTLSVLLFCLATLSCNNPSPSSGNLTNNDSSSVTDTAQKENTLEKVPTSIPKNTQHIMGYRLFIEGDFDGDGKKEKLTEHLISTLDGKETNRFYDPIGDQAQMIALQDKKAPYCFISCSNPAIDTFALGKKGNGQLLGLILLRNEGDLNGDGSDEVSYIRHYADWSSINSLHIITYTKTGWHELYQAVCYDSDAPELFDIDILPEKWDEPQYVNVNTLKNYKSRIQKLKPGVITIETYSPGMDYEVIDEVRLPYQRPLGKR